MPSWTTWQRCATTAQEVGRSLGEKVVIADPVDVELEIEWPSSAKYTLAEVGFYFRVLSGEQPDSMFPLVPVTGTIEEGRMRFMFPWVKSPWSYFLTAPIPTAAEKDHVVVTSGGGFPVVTFAFGKADLVERATCVYAR